MRMGEESSRQPRLEVHQSWWAMAGLGDGDREWPLEHKFDLIAEAGFTGILGRLPEPQDAKRWRYLLDQYGFSFGVHSFPATVQDLTDVLVRAADFGVDYVNAQVMDAFVIGEDAIRLLDGLIRTAQRSAIPFYVETHRGRITQDLIRTAEYVSKLPDLRLTIDMSHYVLGGEMESSNEKAERLIDRLLERTACIHGRISNGQQIQIDVGTSDLYHPITDNFMRWWEKGMNHWLQAAKQGDVLPFVCELGPPGYSIVHPETKREISDRWHQALVLKGLAEQAWMNAHPDDDCK